MRFQANDFKTGAALQGRVAQSLLTRSAGGRELAAGDALGRYRIEAELGRGGMGVVYRASRSDGEYRQQVALKWMIGWQAGPEVELLFRRERQALADLAHPHIARLLDGGSEAGQPWFAMELVDGQPIDRHCAQQALPIRARLLLLRQVCAAVAHAHARGVLHRDIKPGNVLVTGSGEVKLLDFGIARLVDQEDSAGLAAFTPGYASPEQQRGETPTVASDVYQLGRLIEACLRAGADDRPPPALPRDLLAIVARACAAAVEQRYPTVQALDDELARVLALRPVVARGRAPGYRLLRFLQRHPFGSLATSLTVLAALAMAIWFTSRLREQRDFAEAQAAVARSTLAFVREDLLAAADPGARPGRELSVREALDSAAQGVAQRFAGQPLEQAAVRLTLGELYLELGRHAQALEQGQAATALLPTTAPEELAQRSRLLQLDALLALDQLDPAQALLDAHSPAADSEWDPAFTARRGQLLQRRGDYQAAEPLLEAAQAEAERRFGAASGLARRALADRAFTLQMLGRHDDAYGLLEAALAAELQQLGPDHPDSLQTAHALGTLDRHRGRFDAAAARLSEVMERRVVVLGAGHPDSVQTRSELATVLQEQRRYAEAEPLFREVLTLREARYGETHLSTRTAMSNLGLLYSLWGKLDQAAALYERTLAIEVPLIGEQHPDTLALMHNIAGLYRKQGNFDAALAMHRRAIEGASAALGEDSWQAGMFRVGHALSLRAAEQWAAAESEMQAAVQVIETALGADHARSQRAREMLEQLRNERAAAQPARVPLR